MIQDPDRELSFVLFFYSFEPTELDSPDAAVFSNGTGESRIRRIARGSGTSLGEVQLLLMQYKKFAEMIKTMGGKGGLLQGGMPKNPQQMAKMNQSLSKLNPALMQQMGGVGGLQNMMKQLQSGGGDLSKMMGNMDLGALSGMMGGAGGGGMAGLAEMMGGMGPPPQQQTQRRKK